MFISTKSIPSQKNINQDELCFQEPKSLHHYRTEIPNCILDANLSPTELAVYLQIKRIAGDNGRCFMSQKKLADKCCISEKTLRVTLTKLCEIKQPFNLPLLIKTNRAKADGSKDTCIYIIVDLWGYNMKTLFQNNSGTVQHDGGVGQNLPEGGVKFTDKQDPLKKNPIKKDNVCINTEKRRTVSSQIRTKNRTLDEPTKYKLTEQQGGVFTWLKENCGGVQSGTLCYWAKYYTFDRIKEVFLESKSRKPKSLGAYMNSLFKMNAIVPNDTSKECREFAEFYKKSVGWHDLKIEKKFVTFSVGKNREELFLHIPPEQFAKILMEKYQSQRRY